MAPYQLDRLPPVGGLAQDLQPRLQLEDQPHPLPDERFVVGDDDPKSGHGDASARGIRASTCHPCSVRPEETVPSKTRTRSVRPARPRPEPVVRSGTARPSSDTRATSTVPSRCTATRAYLGVAVADDVRQRLLDHPEDRGRDAGGDLTGFGVELDLEAAGAHLLHEAGQVLDARRVRRARAEQREEPLHVGQGIAAGPLDAGECLVGEGVLRALAGAPRLQGDQGECVGQGVVQVARDPGALGPGGLGRGSFRRQLGPDPAVGADPQQVRPAAHTTTISTTLTTRSANRNSLGREVVDETTSQDHPPAPRRPVRSEPYQPTEREDEQQGEERRGHRRRADQRLEAEADRRERAAPSGAILRSASAGRIRSSAR